MDAYSRWALILGWALIRINTVVCKFLVQSFCKYLHYNIFLFSYIFLSFFISLVDLLCWRGKSCVNNWSERIAPTRSECSKRHLLYLPKATKRINSFYITISALLPINTFRSIGFAHIFLIAQPSLNVWVFHESLCARTPLCCIWYANVLLELFSNRLSSSINYLQQFKTMEHGWENCVFYGLFHILGTRDFFSRATRRFVGRHAFGHRPKTRAAKGTEGTQDIWLPEYLFHPSSGLEKNSNYIVHWVRSSHVLFAQGHFLPLLVNDFVRRWFVWTSCSLGE